MAAKRAKQPTGSRKAPAPRPADPVTYADPVAHADLIARFREWSRVSDIWAARESGDPIGEAAWEDMGRLSAECRGRLSREVPAGVRLVIEPETEYTVYHGGSEGTYNFEIDREKDWERRKRLAARNGGG
jgi:hypothetical protein